VTGKPEVGDFAPRILAELVGPLPASYLDGWMSLSHLPEVPQLFDCNGDDIEEHQLAAVVIVRRDIGVIAAV